MIRAWAIIRPNNEILLSSISESKLMCIQGFLLVHKKYIGATWEEWLEYGYSCKHVTVITGWKRGCKERHS